MINVFIITLILIAVTYAFGLVYAVVNGRISINLQTAFGWKGFCVFAAIGTPFHELTHLIMSLIFFHKITEVKFFRPFKAYKEKKAGNTSITLGYVNHTFNKKNPYQMMGNFFIGASPMILGMGSIVLLLRFLFPDCFIDAAALNISNFKVFTLNILKILFDIFSLENIRTWQFWVLIFFIVAISSHMDMSMPDVKGSFLGLIPLIILSQLIPALVVAFTPVEYITIYNLYFMVLTYYLFILIFGLIISLALWMFFYFMKSLKKR